MAENKQNNPNQIVIVLTGALGDIARAFSLLAPLKARYPTTKIAWLVERRWVEIVQLHPLIDQIFIFDRKSPLQSLFSLKKQFSKLGGVDLTLDLQRIFKSAILAKITGAKRTIGVNRANAKEWSWLFHREHTQYHQQGLSKIGMYHRFLELLNIPVPSERASALQTFSLPAPRMEQVADSKIWQVHADDIAFVLGSSWNSKDWHPSGYNALAAQVLENTTGKVVLVGDRRQLKVAESIAQAVFKLGNHSERILNLVGATTLTELAYVLSKVRAAVGPDSGPGHLCAAYGVPYIGLFGPTDIKITAPYKFESLAVRAQVGCAPCYRRECPGLDQLCMRLISPASVWERLRTAIAL